MHRNDRNNVGDIASNPLQYFCSQDDYQVIDIVDIAQTAYDNTVPLIVGGGGLINNDFFGESARNVLGNADYSQLMDMWRRRWNLCDTNHAELQQRFLNEYQELIKRYVDQLQSSTAPRYLWGAGHNADPGKKLKNQLEYPNWISEFTQIGVRDWNQNLPWAPCASCMHPSLRKKHSIKNEVIWFEHKKQLIKDFGSDSIPRFVNSGDNVEQTIELLGSANIILTNSYHGAFWGTLMKKRVIVVGPWSTKFINMRHAPKLITADQNWRDVVDTVTIYPDALDECITATEQFWHKVKQK